MFPATEVLLQLASDAFPRDMTLALAYLLALPQVLDANRCFEKQSHSALSLQLAAYYYSLQIYNHLVPCLKANTHTLYRADPKELIRLVTQHVTAHSDWPADVEELIGQLQVYNERLTDLTQARVLQGLGRGVDIKRFSSDTHYKKHTILGLTETLDDSVWRISLSLAQRYSIPLWDIYMTHLEYLFTDSGLSTKDIEARVDTLALFDSLKSQPESFHSHMSKYVLTTVEGTDLPRLLYYYALLEECGCGSYCSSIITPDTHIKLLKKLRSVTTGKATATAVTTGKATATAVTTGKATATAVTTGKATATAVTTGKATATAVTTGKATATAVTPLDQGSVVCVCVVPPMGSELDRKLSTVFSRITSSPPVPHNTRPSNTQHTHTHQWMLVT
uniref:Uncharacterized protein n=1 Tax=Hucho hucho TaxID=62062 RepID=A0A4W5M3D7_9TELE